MQIVFVGLSGVPYQGRACDPRLATIANLLIKEAEVCILNRYSTLCKRHVNDIALSKAVVIKEIITPCKSKKLSTIVLFVLSVLIEPFVLLRMRCNKRIDILHVYSGHYFDFVLYYCISRLIGAKVIYEYVEYRSEKDKTKSLYHQWNGKMCDRYGAHLWDGCIAISNFLEQQAKAVNPHLPTIKVTPLCDFSIFEKNNKRVNQKEPYLMFCGHANYYEIIKQIIDAYECSVIHRTKKLLLVLSGEENQIRRVKEYAPNSIIKNRLAYEELISYYKNAFALIIPLRDTIEDKARFPNKLCEYTAVGGLIVSTNFGEIPYYFRDGDNAVIAQECTSAAIARKFDEIENGMYDVESIKRKCQETGQIFFSDKAYQTKLPDFIKSIITL